MSKQRWMVRTVGVSTAALVLGLAPWVGPVSATPKGVTWAVVGGNLASHLPDEIGDGGPALDAPVDDPETVAAAPDGSVYFVQRFDRIRRIGPDGMIDTVAGGGATEPADGLVATAADLDEPQVAVGPTGTVYVTSHRSLFTLSGGQLHALPYAPASGEASTTDFEFQAIDIDAQGRLLVVDNGRIRRVATDGTATTIAGGGTNSVADGQPAVGMNLSPLDVAAAPDGSTYLVAKNGVGSNIVFRFGIDGKIRWVFGNTASPFPVCSKPPLQYFPTTRRIDVDRRGRLFVVGDGVVGMLRTDGHQQLIAAPTNDATWDLDIDSLDRLVVTSQPNGSTAGHLIRSTPPVERATCPAAPYSTPTKLVDALAARYLVSLNTTQRAETIDEIRKTQLDPAELVDDYEHRNAFATTVSPVSRLYQASIGRRADTGGLTYWTAKRRSGTTLRRIADSFIQSSEFKRTYGPLTNAKFVDLVYLNVLGRAPDAGGRTYWINKLNAGTARGQFMINFSESGEYVAKQRPTTEVTLATFGLLGRAPTGPEISEWTTQLDRATPVDQFLATVWYGAEHRKRITGS